MTLRQPKILVVDDNGGDSAAMREILVQLRCLVEVAPSGNEALAACVRSDFALIFLAIELSGMDGYEVAELLKGEASTRHIPIIFMTASAGDEARRLHGYRIGAIDTIEKPVSRFWVLAKAGVFLDLYASKEQLKLELARSEAMRASARQNEARYREAINDAPIPIMLHAEDGQVILVNRLWLKLTGYARAELSSVEAWIATAFGEYGDAVRSRVSQLYDITGVTQEGEYRVRTAAGDELIWDFRAAPLAALPDGRRMIISMVQDLTSYQASLRAAAEAKRMAEAADRAKGEFLANMSHEIRTPLHVIMGLGHLLRRDAKDPESQERLGQICATSDHLLAIINDVLDLSKIDAQRLTLDRGDFELDTAVTKVVRIVEGRAHEKGLTLTTDVTPHLRDLALNGDAQRLAQVLINLAGNAVKFTDQGGVRLIIDCLAEDTDQVTLRFTVEDTGIGIAPADQARLFQAFEQADSSTTRERGGTGLGLVISQRLVALMGGAIQVHSALGTGSTFSFNLVLPRATAKGAEATATVAPTDFRGKHVLFAEDHPLSQEIILEMLEDLGCVGDVASDGAEAVSCARERNYDLILMDMQMPKMDGLAATRAIRALPGHRDTPIVALTADAFAEDRQRCLDAGMNGHLGKPVTPATLAAALGQWLPNLAPPDPAPPQARDNELSRALTRIPGLEVGQTWRRSPDRLVDYCAQLLGFLKVHGEDVTRLREHLATGEQAAARTVIHKLNGIAGLIGARRIASLAIELAQQLNSGADETVIQCLADECEAELAGLTEAVRTLPVPPQESARA
jgi:two-component system sensor histidine kinase/response regulator